MTNPYLMPFGSHKGRPLHTVPRDYLRWLAGVRLSPWMAWAVERALTGAAVSPPSEADKVDAAKRAALIRLRGGRHV